MSIKDHHTSYEDNKYTTQACFLIPEVTASICRHLANRITNDDPNYQKGKSFKVFYIQKCFRNELLNSLSETKLREFTQLGLEYFGVEKSSVDIEIFQTIFEFLTALGIPSEFIQVRISDVRIFNHLCKRSNLNTDQTNTLKAYIDKVASYKVNKKSDDLLATVVKIKSLLKEYGVSKEKDLNDWEIFFGPNITPKLLRESNLLNGTPDNVISELSSTLKYAEENNLNIVFDPAVVRGQDYYNRLVFQIDIISNKQIRSEVGGGGRYDYFLNRITQSDSQEPIYPATGFAFSLERIALSLVYLGITSMNNVTMHFGAKRKTIKGEDFKHLYEEAQRYRSRGTIVDIQHTQD